MFPLNFYASDSKRRKRNTIEDTFSLDRIFIKDEKQKFELLAKQLKDTYTDNFLKMDVVKSYPNLFELLW